MEMESLIFQSIFYNPYMLIVKQNGLIFQVKFWEFAILISAGDRKIRPPEHWW